MSFVRFYRKFRRNNSGVVAVEFALLVLPFLVLTMGTIQLATIFLANQTMDASVNQAARMIQTGQIQRAGMSKTDFREIICEDAMLVLNCEENLRVSVRSFGSFDQIDTDDLYENGFPIVTDDFDSGTSGSIIVVNVDATMPSIFSTIRTLSALTAPEEERPTIEESSTTRLTSSVVFRNELF